MAAYAHVVDISPMGMRRGRGARSNLWIVKLGVGGKDGNNWRAKHAAKFWIKLFLAVRRHSHCILQSIAILPKISVVLCVRTYVRSYSARFYYSNSAWERDNTKVKRIILSQLQLRMVRPWLDQPNRFQHLC